MRASGRLLKHFPECSFVIRVYVEELFLLEVETHRSVKGVSRVQQTYRGSQDKTLIHSRKKHVSHKARHSDVERPFGSIRPHSGGQGDEI